MRFLTKNRNMRLDFPTILGISTVSVLCIFAVIIGFFGNDLFSDEINESTSVSKLETDAGTLVQLNQQAIKYQKNDEQEKFKGQIKIMHEKLKEIAYNSLGFDVSIYIQTNVFGGEIFPFEDSEAATIKAKKYERFKEDPYAICNIEEKIPIHLKKIGETEMFQMFSKKYSQYDIQLDILDERGVFDSNVHYGFRVTTEDGNKSATTFFHVNSCSETLREPELNYHIWCFDDDKDYGSTYFKDDVIASLEHDEFCIIPLDPWRQSVADYKGTVSRERSQVIQTFSNLFTSENMHKIKDAQEEYDLELDRLELLMKLTHFIFEEKIDEQSTQESIQEYKHRFGDLPEELLKLIEER